MQAERFYEAMQSLTSAARAKVHALVRSQAAPIGRHVQWLVEWLTARNTACDALDNGDYEKTLMDTAHGLRVLLASSPNKSPAGMIAENIGV